MSLAVKRGKHRGDPGLWSQAKEIGIGLLTGGVTGGMTALGRQLGIPGSPQILSPQINPPFGGPPGAGIQITGPGGWGLGFEVGEIGQAAAMLQNGGTRTNGKAPPGYKWNKTGYWVKGTARSPAPYTNMGPTYIAPGSRLVRIRRRNPLNPRAFDRAVSRVGSAKRFSKKLGRVTIRSTCSCN